MPAGSPPVFANDPRADLSAKDGLARIVAIANQKGGVGKTTTAVNLGAEMATGGGRVLLFEADPQGNASSGLGLGEEDVRASAYDVLIRGFPAAMAARRTSFGGLDVVAAGRDLAGAEIELVGVGERESVLRNALEPAESGYDWVLIDCPPALGLLTLNALVAADGVLIPIQCEFYALKGLSELLATIDAIRGGFNPDLRLEGVLLTMYDRRVGLTRQVEADVRRHFGGRVFETAIPRSVALAEAPSFGRPVREYRPESSAAKAYRELSSELARRRAMPA